MAGLDDLRCYDRLLYDFQMLCLLNEMSISMYPAEQQYSADDRIRNHVAFYLMISSKPESDITGMPPKMRRIPVTKNDLWDAESFIQTLLDDVLPDICPGFEMGKQMI